jgi:peptide/nickel transport system permease protein
MASLIVTGEFNMLKRTTGISTLPAINIPITPAYTRVSNMLTARVAWIMIKLNILKCQRSAEGRCGMHKYVVKRLLWIIPILLGVTLIVFTILSFSPGDPARIMLGMTAPDAAVDALREELGLNNPFFIRYFSYVVRALQGDFGISYATQQPVMNDILRSWPVTIKLAFFSTVLGALIAIPTGIISAIKHRSIFDIFATVASMVLMAMPGAGLALLLLLIFSLWWPILPAGGISSWKNFVLPVFCLLTVVATSLMRLVRTTMLDTLKQDYITTIRAKGAPERVVILRHAFKNISLMIITQIGMSFSGLLAGAVLIEHIFGMPGLGSLLMKAIRGKDVPTVMATTIVLSLVCVVTILLLDMIYAYIDPRIKAKYLGGR